MVTKMSNDRKAALKELATAIAEATVDAWLDGEISDDDLADDSTLVLGRDHMAGYMPEDLFEFGAYTIAMIHVAKGLPIEDVADRLHKSYKNSYLDDDIRDQWVEAANIVIGLVETHFPNLEPRVKASTLKHIQTAVMEYQPDGKKRRKKLFGGTIFNKSKTANYQRTKTLSRNFICYHALLSVGLIE
jgi:hypothetical protein